MEKTNFIEELKKYKGRYAWENSPDKDTLEKTVLWFEPAKVISTIWDDDYGAADRLSFLSFLREHQIPFVTIWMPETCVVLTVDNKKTMQDIIDYTNGRRVRLYVADKNSCNIISNGKLKQSKTLSSLQEKMQKVARQEPTLFCYSKAPKSLLDETNFGSEIFPHAVMRCPNWDDLCKIHGMQYDGKLTKGTLKDLANMIRSRKYFHYAVIPAFNQFSTIDSNIDGFKLLWKAVGAMGFERFTFYYPDKDSISGAPNLVVFGCGHHRRYSKAEFKRYIECRCRLFEESIFYGDCDKVDDEMSSWFRLPLEDDTEILFNPSPNGIHGRMVRPKEVFLCDFQEES